MNFVSTNHAAHRERAFTLLEMLIAVALISAFMGGIYTTYIQVAQANQRAMANLEAQRNGRAAILSLSDEIKALTDLGATGLLISPDAAALTYGNGKDDDLDGAVDEELVDGDDDDGGTTTTQTAADDRHAVIDLAAGLFERPAKVGLVDLGDANVDEDVKFGRDFIVFHLTPEAPSDITQKVITYAIPPDGFEGQQNVLVRQTQIERVNPADPTGPPLIEGGQAPIAFGVLGFDLLFLDSNASPEDRDWLTSWDSTDKAGERFTLPASVYIRLTVNADPAPNALNFAGAPIETLVLSTVVDIESVIGSPLFERPVVP